MAFLRGEEIEGELFSELNKKALKSVGKNIWTHGDTVEIIRQLKNSGKVESDNFLWKGNLRVAKK
mgnify:FL=1